jgi:hypothetical protein
MCNCLNIAEVRVWCTPNGEDNVNISSSKLTDTNWKKCPKKIDYTLYVLLNSHDIYKKLEKIYDSFYCDKTKNPIALEKFYENTKNIIIPHVVKYFYLNDDEIKELFDKLYDDHCDNYFDDLYN